jgi:hypothetical protein
LVRRCVREIAPPRQLDRWASLRDGRSYAKETHGIHVEMVAAILARDPHRSNRVSKTRAILGHLLRHLGVRGNRHDNPNVGLLEI